MAKPKQKRLTKDMKGAILQSIISNTVIKRSDDLYIEMKKIGDEIYDLCMSEYVEKIDELPEGFLPINNEIRILCLTKDDSVSKPMLHGPYSAIHNPEGKSIGFAKVFRKNEYDVVPAMSNSGREPFVISEENPLVEEYIKLEKERCLVNGSEYSTRRQIATALEKFTTVAALAEQWPEIVEYIPGDILNEEKVFAIAVRLEDVNAIIGKYK